jgi:hypothetical protein
VRLGAPKGRRCAEATRRESPEGQPEAPWNILLNFQESHLHCSRIDDSAGSITIVPSKPKALAKRIWRNLKTAAAPMDHSA